MGNAWQRKKNKIDSMKWAPEDVASFMAEKMEFVGKSTVACSFCGRMLQKTNMRSGGPEGDFRWDYCEFCDEIKMVADDQEG